MKITATAMLSKELEPGDLFSTATQFYWDHRDPMALGEKVYIRTDAPTPDDQRNEPIFKITIEEE